MLFVLYAKWGRIDQGRTIVGQSNSVKCLLCKVGPDRLGPHRPDGAGSTGAASTSGAGSTGAASTWGRIGLGPVGFGAGSTYYPWFMVVPAPLPLRPQSMRPQSIRPQYQSGPNTNPAPNLSGPRSIRPHITKHKICTSIYQPCPVRPHYSCNRRSIRPHVLYTYSWSGPMQLSMKFAPLYLRFYKPCPIRQEHRSHNNSFIQFQLHQKRC